MFLNYLKRFSVKKIVKNSAFNTKSSVFSGNIKTIGIIVDEHSFANTTSLVDEFVANGIAKEAIELLLYKSKRETTTATKLEAKHLNWKAEFKNEAVKVFLAKDFDLLVSYYDVEKAVLLAATYESKAKFKVGFSTIDKRLNNLMITINLENYSVFVQELFRYLKILNKI